jgi:amino acid adenylation domain-containing protein
VTAPFTLHAALARAAEQWPDRPAVSDSGGTWSYAELAEAAGRIAGGLRQLGVRPGDRVAVSAEKTPTTVAALYGVMAAGGVYVPIDPQAPPIRARTILADAGCSIVCADGERSRRLLAGPDAPRVQVLALTDDVEDPAIALGELHEVAAEPLGAGCEADLAYILYTSGSTGTPKGVMLTHRNALAFVEWAVGRFAVTADDRLSSHAPFHFDLSVFDLYAASLSGASVHLVGAAEGAFAASMVELIREQGITVWYSVPSALVLLRDVAAPEDVATLRLVLFAGEVFPPKHLSALRRLVPHGVLANLYGPTETNVCTYYVVGERVDGDTPVPIGRACENQEVFVLDDDRRLVPDGDVGELWVRGPTVMKGYWADPAMTADRLVQNPLHDDFPDPAYRTGDLVRRSADGELHFLGRRDHQIKSRGYRIELGEIEAALVSHEAVRQAAVIAVPDDRLGHALIAFAAGDAPPEELSLKRHCAERIPRYMVPTRITVLDALPLTSTGKIDREALTRLAGER